MKLNNSVITYNFNIVFYCKNNNLYDNNNNNNSYMISNETHLYAMLTTNLLFSYSKA